MKICVITRCDDFADDYILLRGNQWRYYYECTPPGRQRRIKFPPFYRGEILLLDDNDREIGPLQRKPYKWGAELSKSQGRCQTEFVIVDSLEEAAILQEKLLLSEIGVELFVEATEKTNAG